MRRGSAWLLSPAVVIAAGVACRIPNEEHCGRRSGDATCSELDSSRPYCSICEAEHDGCVESLDEIPDECRPEQSEDMADSSSTSQPETGTNGESESGDSESAETGPGPECGNGIREAGEACDGTDFGEASCADPYELPEGTLVCVPGECVIDTSQCCRLDGELCEAGDCCNANCNLVTNKCGL